MNFNGKVALVTGAAVGIGRATALKLANLGAKLILIDIDEAGLERLKNEIGSEETLIFKCDVSDYDAVIDIVGRAQDHFSKIDLLVNNAALWRSWAPFVDTDVSEWIKYINVNVMGVVHLTKTVLPGMIARGYGKIVNVASVAGVYGNANMVHYSATKGAVISLTQALAKEVSDKGICVNAVSPGSVSPSGNLDVNHTQPSELSYMGRTGSDMENADLICFLLSEESTYITGQNIQIDGCRRRI